MLVKFILSWKLKTVDGSHRLFWGDSRLRCPAQAERCPCTGEQSYLSSSAVVASPGLKVLCANEQRGAMGATCRDKLVLRS